ncbi:hypothetical protein ANCDUO_25221 [Ancylostoma duodenale]|uniref:Serine-threonine/tyrosine-protein kinase catalytic domain-containing protein n=1 Tax=Ancylostoma duodenale TaxID=51022 RepID=A0A0C2FIH3_9BILA|nr:hypothetical protein ANCDUO_25221 [Ancylostoma duodenale]
MFFSYGIPMGHQKAWNTCTTTIACIGMLQQGYETTPTDSVVSSRSSELWDYSKKSDVFSFGVLLWEVC